MLVIRCARRHVRRTRSLYTAIGRHEAGSVCAQGASECVGTIRWCPTPKAQSAPAAPAVLLLCAPKRGALGRDTRGAKKGATVRCGCQRAAAWIAVCALPAHLRFTLQHRISRVLSDRHERARRGDGNWPFSQAALRRVPAPARPLTALESPGPIEKREKRHPRMLMGAVARRAAWREAGQLGKGMYAEYRPHSARVQRG